MPEKRILITGTYASTTDWTFVASMSLIVQLAIGVPKLTVNSVTSGRSLSIVYMMVKKCSRSTCLGITHKVSISAPNRDR